MNQMIINDLNTLGRINPRTFRPSSDLKTKSLLIISAHSLLVYFPFGLCDALLVSLGRGRFFLLRFLDLLLIWFFHRFVEEVTIIRIYVKSRIQIINNCSEFLFTQTFDGKYSKFALNKILINLSISK